MTNRPEIRTIPSVFRDPNAPMSQEERSAAIEMARQCLHEGKSKADLADVLGALGFLNQKQVTAVEEALKLESDPNYVRMCPDDKHPAKGNMYRAHDGRQRCRPCGQELGVARRQATKEARGAW